MPRTKQLRYDQFKKDSYCLAFDNFRDRSKENLNSLIVEDLTDIISQYKKVVLELCAGYCEYSLGLAKNNKETDKKTDKENLYIAIDIKEDRLMSGCLIARSLGLTNIRFLSSDIANLDLIFEGNIDNILLIHPDPQNKNQKQRLNQIKYFEVYYKLLKSKSTITLITDNYEFYEEFGQNYSKKLWQEVTTDIEVIRTRYNKIFVDEKNSSKVITLEKKIRED